MSDFNVENFTYEYAHKCYLQYVAGNTGAADSMYEKGKEVANSPKWLNDVTKWQTEDVNVYDMDEEGLENHQAQDKTGKDGATAGAAVGAAAGVAAGAAAGTMTAVTTITGSTAASAGVQMATNGLITKVPTITQSAETGSLAAAIVYSVFGVLFLVMTSIFKVNAQNGRKDQEAYFNTADEIMKYDFDSKIAEAETMNSEMASFAEEASALTKAANIEVAAANTIGASTEVSEQNVSVSAKSVADEGASKVIDEIDSMDEGILENLPRLESIMNEVQARKDMVNKIKDELPKFEKNRKEQVLLMSLLTGGAALGAIAGGIGLGLSWTNYLLAPAAMALFFVGIAAFAASAIVAATEISPQSKAQKAASQGGEEGQKVTETLNKANAALGSTRSVFSAGNTNEAALSNMSSEAREEDANVNVKQAA